MATKMTKKNNIIIIGVALVALSCGNGKGGKMNEPYDGGHGIGIDTATVHEIERYEDSLRADTLRHPLPKEFKDGHMPPPSPDGKRPDGKRPDGPPPDGKRPDGPPPPPPDGKRPDGPPLHDGKGRPPHKPDNMRGFDPASEDDMPDNGMSRYMENNDEEGWD